MDNVVSMKSVGADLAILHDRLNDEVTLNAQTALEVTTAIRKAREAAQAALTEAVAKLSASYDELEQAVTDQFTDRSMALAEVLDGGEKAAAE